MVDVGSAGIRAATFSITDEHHGALGTAFCVNVIDSSRPGSFLLTAGHSVRMAKRALMPLHIIGVTGISWPAKVLACTEGWYPDVGLIYVQDHIAEPVTCVADTTPGPVIVRGCPSGVVTQQATLRGWLSGLETLGSDEFLDVTLSDLSLIETSVAADPRLQGRSDVYSVLRGLSGAPVVVSGEIGHAMVSGLVVRRNIRGLANRVYAVPTRSAEGYLSDQGFVLQLDHRVMASGASLSALAGRLMMRLLQSSIGMHQLWEELSGLFYQGLPVDALIRTAIQYPTAYGLDDGIVVHELEFLLARLVQKRGHRSDAMKLLRSAGTAAAKGRTPAHRRLSALVHLRELGGFSFTSLSAQRRLVFEDAIGRYEELSDFGEQERAYEIASALGVEADFWSNGGAFVGGQLEVRSYFVGMMRKHRRLLSEYPETLLEKQEIVQLMLQLTSALWGLDDSFKTSDRAELILAIAARGSVAALQRNNAIFYCQMIIAQAVAARIRGDDEAGFFLAGAAADSLAKSQLTFNHEGLRVLRGYIRVADPALWELLEAVSRRGMAQGISSLLNTGTLATGSERIAMVHARQRLDALVGSVSAVSDLFQLTL